MDIKKLIVIIETKLKQRGKLKRFGVDVDKVRGALKGAGLNAKTFFTAAGKRTQLGKAAQEAGYNLTTLSHKLGELGAKSIKVTTRGMGEMGDVVTKGGHKFNIFKNIITNTGESLELYSKKFGGAMSKLEALSDGDDSLQEVQKNTKSYGEAAIKGGKKTRWFRGEMLGLMFMTRALSMRFGGLVKAQMKLFGVTGMLSAMWTSVFAPLMAYLVPIIADLISSFIDLPGPIKGIISVFIVLAWAFLSLLVIITMFKISGLAAIKAAFLESMLPALAWLGVILLAVGAVWLFYKAFKAFQDGDIIRSIIYGLMGIAAAFLVVAAAVALATGGANIIGGLTAIGIAGGALLVGAGVLGAMKMGGKKDDFIWRSGQGAVSISPDDDIIGTKEGLGGAGGTINLNVDLHGGAFMDESSIDLLAEKIKGHLIGDLRRLGL